MMLQSFNSQDTDLMLPLGVDRNCMEKSNILRIPRLIFTRNIPFFLVSFYVHMICQCRLASSEGVIQM